MPHITYNMDEKFETTVRDSAFTAEGESGYRLDPSISGFDVYLPVASGLNGQDILFYVESDDPNEVTVIPSSLDTINGEPFLSLKARDSVELTSNGASGWVVLSTPVLDNVLTRTRSHKEYFCDADNGDDNNNGASWATAKQTIRAAWDLVPYEVNHMAWINLRGTFTNTNQGVSGTVLLNRKNIAFGGNIVLSGDYDDKTTILGPLTSDGGSTSTISLSSLTMTPDEYVGYTIEILDGSYVGQRRLITFNTTDTFSVNKNFSGSVSGAQFYVYQPATTIDEFKLVFGDLVGNGQISVQNLTTTGPTSTITAINIRSALNLANVLINTLGSQSMFIANANINFQYFSRYYDQSTLYGVGTRSTTDTFLGASIINKKKIFLSLSELGTSWGSVLGRIEGEVVIDKVSGNTFDYGTRIIGGVKLTNFQGANKGSHLLYNRSGYGQGQISDGTIGLELINSNASIGGNLNPDISNNSSHAIRLENSNLLITRALTGSGNTGAGLYACRQSYAETTTGQEPTISGVIGEISTDGTTQSGTWADVAAGNPVIDISRMTVIREGA